MSGVQDNPLGEGTAQTGNHNRGTGNGLGAYLVTDGKTTRQISRQRRCGRWRQSIAFEHLRDKVAEFKVAAQSQLLGEAPSNRDLR